MDRMTQRLSKTQINDEDKVLDYLVEEEDTESDGTFFCWCFGPLKFTFILLQQ